MFAPRLQPRTFEACLRDLGDPKARVRADAARDMARHVADERDRAVEALVKALSDGDAEVRAAAATGLADAAAKEAFEPLERAAGDGSAVVRQMAIAALGELDEPRALPTIEAALADKQAQVRFQAVIAYPRLAVDPEDKLRALEAGTRDEDPFVAHIALRMAEEIGATAGEVDARLLRRARALLGHASPLVQVAAAVLLGRGGERAGDDVLAAVARGDLKTPEGSDEACAIELCGEIGLEAARAGLERRAYGGGLLGLLRDPFQWHARVALARMGDERARREIRRDLASSNPDKRVLAVAAAGRARLRDVRELLVSMRRDRDIDTHAVDEALRALDEPT